MNIKVTKKAVIEGCPRVIGIPYCAAQTLLAGCEPVAYVERSEGWAADVYLFPEFNAAIVTGYAPFGNIRPCRDFIEPYERAALEIVKNTRRPEVRAALNDKLREFINHVLYDWRA